MRMSEECDKIASALAKLQADASKVNKGGTVKYGRGDNATEYSYARLEDFWDMGHELLIAHGLSVLTSVAKVEPGENRTTHRGGTEYHVRMTQTVRLMHTSGQWVEIDVVSEGQDSADKAAYKAMTGGKKYGWAAILGVPTSDDPEADSRVGESAAPVGAGRPVPSLDDELPADGDHHAWRHMVGLALAKWTGFAGDDDAMREAGKQLRQKVGVDEKATDVATCKKLYTFIIKHQNEKFEEIVNGG